MVVASPESPVADALEHAGSAATVRGQDAYHHPFSVCCAVAVYSMVAVYGAVAPGLVMTTATMSRPAAAVGPPKSPTARPRRSYPPLAPVRPEQRPTSVPAEPLDADLPEAELLLVRLGRLVPGSTGWLAVRAEVIERYLPWAASLARRFAGRGEPLADLTQVATIGLIKSVDRFDAGRGVPFASYATPTIIGGIKRHFRDTTWNVRVPRRLQELKWQMGIATEDLAQALHRSPTTAELANRLDVSAEDVRAARLAANAYRTASLDQPLRVEGRGLLDTLGDPDPRIVAVDSREALRVGLAALPVRDRRIIGMRFFADMTQAQIAAELGISQMHVSRLLAGALLRLRAMILAVDTDESRTRSDVSTMRSGDVAYR
jgi:RNA polymerase sigma-B factor